MLRPLSADVKRSLEEATALYERSQNTILPLLAKRGVSPATAERFRLGLVGTSTDSIYPGHERMAGRLAIPSIGPNGGVQSLRFRCLADHDCHETGCSKYMGLAGVPTRLFNTRAIHEAGDVVALAEGEMDAVILNQVGVPAVGVVGVHNWKDYHRRIFDGFTDVIVCGDNDDPGRQFTERLVKAIPQARAVHFGVDSDDVSSFYTREGEDALRHALGLIGV